MREESYLLQEALELLRRIRDNLRGDRTLNINEIYRISGRDPIRTRILISILIDKGYIEEIPQQDLKTTCSECILRRFCSMGMLKRGGERSYCIGGLTERIKLYKIREIANI
ncbi:MAG: hypothetical protein QXE32_02770 [Sulfolobales archaeon]